MCVSKRAAVHRAFVLIKMGTEDWGAGTSSQELYRAPNRARACWSRLFHLCCAPLLPNPGTSSHLSSLPRWPTVGRPTALKTAPGPPVRQAPHSPVPQAQLPGQLCRRTTSSDGLLVTKAWEPCACCP